MSKPDPHASLIIEKRRTNCKAWKPGDAEHFSRKCDAYDGLSPWCKTCSRARDRAYRQGPKGAEQKRQENRRQAAKARLFAPLESVARMLLREMDDEAKRQPMAAYRMAKAALAEVRRAGL